MPECHLRLIRGFLWAGKAASRPVTSKFGLARNERKGAKVTKSYKTNVVQLIAKRMAVQIIPSGSKTALEQFIDAVLSNRLGKEWKDAEVWVATAIVAVRNAGEPNPFKHLTDDEIAGEILKRAEAITILQTT